jgi:PST family polysaccharide transporter
MTQFRKAVLRGLTWRSSLDIASQVLQVVFMAILARLLTRADFGLVAMALVVTRLPQTLTQIGFGSAVIQDQDVDERHVSAVFWLQLAINSVMALTCWAIAPYASGFFDQPGLAPVVSVMGLLLVVNAFSFPSIIARKRMQFGGYTLLEGIALVVANVVGIVMAYAGLGVWSLVARLAVQRAVFAFAVWFIVDWRPVRPQFRGIGRLVRFGVHILGANICYYASQNMASLITGKFLGVETLGSLSIAFNLAVVPAQRIQSVLTTVLTPAFAKMNKSLEGLRTRIYKSLFTLGVLFIPMMLGLAAIQAKAGRRVGARMWTAEAERIKAGLPEQTAA